MQGRGLGDSILMWLWGVWNKWREVEGEEEKPCLFLEFLGIWSVNFLVCSMLFQAVFPVILLITSYTPLFDIENNLECYFLYDTCLDLCRGNFCLYAQNNNMSEKYPFEWFVCGCDIYAKGFCCDYRWNSVNIYQNRQRFEGTSCNTCELR